jgi:hypothetical protein
MALNRSWCCCGQRRDIIRESFEAEGHRAAIICPASDSISHCVFEAQCHVYIRSGLQGSYNAYSEKRGFRVPHGDVLVFALS